jgi:hypothetical protein
MREGERPRKPPSTARILINTWLSPGVGPQRISEPFQRFGDLHLGNPVVMGLTVGPLAAGLFSLLSPCKIVPFLGGLRGVCVKSLILFLLAAGMLCAHAQPKEIVLIRHAEEPSGNSNHLSAKGRKRADALAQFFQTNAAVTRFGTPVALFAARPKPGGSQRAVETLTPTAQALGEPIRQPFTDEQYGALALKILHTPSFKGKTVVIAWTHSNIDALAAALGVRPKPHWNSSVYDRAWVIVRSQNGVTLRDIPQHLLPGDSKR